MSAGRVILDLLLAESRMQRDEVNFRQGDCMSRVARFALEKSIDSLTFLRGIPGTIGGALRGDLGTSIRYRKPAVEVFMERLPNTLTLVPLAYVVRRGLVHWRWWIMPVTLLYAGLPLTLNMVVHRQNLAGVPDMIEMAHRGVGLAGVGPRPDPGA